MNLTSVLGAEVCPWGFAWLWYAQHGPLSFGHKPVSNAAEFFFALAQFIYLLLRKGVFCIQCAASLMSSPGRAAVVRSRPVELWI